MSWRDLSSELDISYNGSALFATAISRPRLAKVALKLKNKNLVHLAESGLYWDEVVSINSLGIEDVYDMSIPGTYNFVANDFIVHNSIEQDADVVMFIHRDDRDKEADEKTNIAEILIEKHRNGPTGKVELYFDLKTTTFLSLEKNSLSEFSAPKIAGELDEF
jgi:replicative DNA helicase